MPQNNDAGPGLSDAEVEVVCLIAVVEFIDAMVNCEIFKVLGQDPDSEIGFHTSTHKKLFYILLVDFLSKTDQRASVPADTYLCHLRRIVASPTFGDGDSITALTTAVTDFKNWLEHEPEIPSINTQAILKLSRWDMLRICGDISKHSFLKSGGIATRLRELLSANNVSVTQDEALLGLSDFYEQFHTDVLHYHSSTIAEFLNNIRWGIHEYLQPQFQRSFVKEPDDPRKYHYTYHPDVTGAFAKTCYWDLMNTVRAGPIMPRFQVSAYLKAHY